MTKECTTLYIATQHLINTYTLSLCY